MTREDLEKDAKLVTGYDPSNVVDKITSKTKSALNTAKTSTGYMNILTGFTDMGSTYVKAIGEGATSQSSTLMNTALDMINKCREKIDELNPSWITTGAQLINGLIQGVNNRRSAAINGIYSIAISMINAANKALIIRSPSRAFAEIGIKRVFRG